MKITLPMANQTTLTFSGFEELAQHYINLANAHLKSDRPRGEAYAVVAWQLSPGNGFKIDQDEWTTQQQPNETWDVLQNGKFRAGAFGTEKHAETWIEKFTRSKDKLLKISYCSAGVSDHYFAGNTTIREDQLSAWIFDQLRGGKPVLITNMDEV
jgi:hypothetical protein